VAAGEKEVGTGGKVARPLLVSSIDWLVAVATAMCRSSSLDQLPRIKTDASPARNFIG